MTAFAYLVLAVAVVAVLYFVFTTVRSKPQRDYVEGAEDQAEGELDTEIGEYGRIDPAPLSQPEKSDTPQP